MSGETVQPNDIHACHRLKNKNHVICKFKFRKRKHAIIMGRRKIQDSAVNKNIEEEKAKKDRRRSLGGGRIWINESLSSHFASVQWKCRMLHKQFHIDLYWFFNGHLHMKL